MFIEALFGIGFATMCGSVLFPEETARLKDRAKKATILTKSQMSASAYTKEGCLVKAYRSQEEARFHRAKLDIGTVILLPNGTNITVEQGLTDIESEGWWYAWSTI